MPMTLSTRSTLARSFIWTAWTRMLGSNASEESDGGGEISYEAGQVLGQGRGGQGEAPALWKGRGQGGVSLLLHSHSFRGRLGRRATADLPMTCSPKKTYCPCRRLLSILDTEAVSLEVVLKGLVSDATWIKGFVPWIRM